MPTFNYMSDVVGGSGFPPQQTLGLITCLAPKGGDVFAQIQRGSQFPGPDPSGINIRYDKRFDKYKYYTS